MIDPLDMHHILHRNCSHVRVKLLPWGSQLLVVVHGRFNRSFVQLTPLDDSTPLSPREVQAYELVPNAAYYRPYQLMDGNYQQRMHLVVVASTDSVMDMTGGLEWFWWQPVLKKYLRGLIQEALNGYRPGWEAKSQDLCLKQEFDVMYEKVHREADRLLEGRALLQHGISRRYFCIGL